MPETDRVEAPQSLMSFARHYKASKWDLFAADNISSGMLMQTNVNQDNIDQI